MSAHQDTNVVILPTTRCRRRASAPDPLAVLADLAGRVAEIGLIPLQTRQDLELALMKLDLSNAQARQLIGEIDDPESRGRLLAHSERIGELIKVARRKAATI